MSLRSQFATDKKLEQEGVWVEVGTDDANGDPIEFLVTRISDDNKDYNRAIAAAGKSHRNLKAIRNNVDQYEIQNRIAKEAFIETVLKDWRNVAEWRQNHLEAAGITFENGEPVTPKDGDGNELPMPFVAIPFNKQNAEFLMGQLPDLYKLLQTMAADMETFRPSSGDRSDDVVGN